ncbi:MAG: type IV secretion system protein VirB10 [Pseudomonadota bacterium]
MKQRFDQAPLGEVPEPSGIVSVNSRGGTSSGIGGKLAFALAAGGLLVVGSVMAFNKYSLNPAAASGAGKAAAEVVRQRRSFNSDPSPASSRAGTSAPAAPPAGCSDGKPSMPLLTPDGQPIPDAAGNPIQICKSGHMAVSATASARELAAPSAPPPPTTGVPTAAPASRYGGEVVLGQPVMAPSPASTAPESETMLAADSTDAVALPPGQAHTGIYATRHPERAAGVPAFLDHNRDLVLPEGRSIDCSLTVRIVTEVDGMATCVLTSHAYSDSGRVVLAERGSVVTGQYRATLAQGQRRLFVLWTRLRTPTGVVIALDSPAADALGTAGLPGQIDNRWAERIGAAVLLSLVQDAVGYQTARASGTAGAEGIAVFEKSTETGRNLAERILESTINIKPTLYKNQGDRATIMVARDLDFASVYALRAQ